MRPHEVGTFVSEQTFNGCGTSPRGSDDGLHVQFDVAGGSSKQQQAATETVKWFRPSSEVTDLSHMASSGNDAPSLFGGCPSGESYIDFDRKPDSKEDDPIILNVGPVLAMITIFNVHASYDLPFAKPPNDLLRFRRAQPLDVSIEVLHKPLVETTGLALKQSVSRHACDQQVSTDLFGTEDCLQLVIRSRASSEQTYGPNVMIWFHDNWIVPRNAWSFPSGHNGAQLTRIHDVVSVCAQYRLAVLGFVILEDLIGDLQARASTHLAFEDQHSVVVWVQDNAAGLDVNKSTIVILGYGMGG